MKRRIVSLILSLLFPISALPCSAFFIPQSAESYMGKSYDWHYGHGYLTINKRNVKKESFQFNADDVSFTWTSKFGSVSFNQYGHEFPLGGINEAGLAIEVLWLSESTYPDASSQRSINESQWIQYMLDSAENIEELITLARMVRISPVQASVHYLACDQKKNCAVIEYLQKNLVIHSNAKNSPLPMDIPSITNSNYDSSENFAQDFKGFGGNEDIPGGYGSLNRFVRASYLAKVAPLGEGNSLSSNYPFEILDSVASSGGFSKFNIVYNLRDKKLFYRTRFDNTAVRSVELSKLNFDCSKPTQTLNLENNLSGDVSEEFSDYSYQENLNMVKKSLPEYPSYVHQLIATYPNSTECMN
ncbi:MAG: linear amide C-N hydrolase [Bdellovibrionales bacterium]|nr:linear amide C-N hydrolase [Bdellovibrionales bacterium]